LNSYALNIIDNINQQQKQKTDAVFLTYLGFNHLSNIDYGSPFQVIVNPAYKKINPGH
jgi:hypothetical protein